MDLAIHELPDVQVSPHAGLEHLLLGDLRQLLEETADPLTDRWLLAVLDMLFAAHPRLPVRTASRLDRRWDDLAEPAFDERGILFAKLRRLRDRIAHRAPYALLANEIRCDLRDVFVG